MKPLVITQNGSAGIIPNISDILQQWGKHLYIVCLCVAAFAVMCGMFVVCSGLKLEVEPEITQRSLDDGLLGPCLLDLQERTGVSFVSASTYITAIGIGSVIGIAAYTFLHSNINAFLVVAVSSTTLSLSVLIIAWSYTYTAMLLTTLVMGICRVLLFTYGISETSSLKEGGRSTYLTAWLISSLVGCVVSPLLVAPYLSDQPFVSSNGTMNSTNETFGRRSELYGITSSTSNLITPFAISASITFTPVPIFFLMFSMYVVGRFKLDYIPPETTQSFQLPMSCRVTSILLVSTLLALGVGFFTGCRHFISAFATQQFRYSKVTSAYLAAVFSFNGLIGRLFTAAVLPYKGYSPLVIFHSSLLLSSSGALYICIVHDISVLEMFVIFSCIGFSSYSIVSLIYVVVDENLFHVRGGVLSFVIFMEMLGIIANSLLKGIFMQRYGFIQFVFIILVQAVMLFILLFPFLCLVKIVEMKSRLSVNDNTHKLQLNAPLPNRSQLQ